MTIIKNMTSNTNMETDQKKPDKTAFKRKFSSDNDATSQVSLTRVSSPLPEREERSRTDILGQLRLSPPAIQSDCSCPSSNASNGHHQTTLQAHQNNFSWRNFTGKSSLRKFLSGAPCHGATQDTLDQARDRVGRIVLPTTQDCHSDAVHVASQTSIFQGRQGPFFFPSSSLALIGSIPLPFDISLSENTDICEIHTTTKLGGQSNNNTNHRRSIGQHRGSSSLQVSLDPLSLPFTPRPVLKSRNVEITQLTTASFTGQHVHHRSFQSHSTGLSLSQFNSHQISSTKNTQVTPKDRATASKPTANESIVRYVPVGVTHRSSSASSIVVPVLSNSVPPATPSSRSARRALPSLPTPPSTPCLGSSARFGDLLPPRKSHKSSTSLPPIEIPLPMPMKRQNPFVDLTLIDGNDSPETYYKCNPIMRPDRLHTWITKPETRKIGPYRKAAVWEFIGQTFEKVARTGLKLRQRKRFKTYAAGAVPLPGTSSLSYQVMATEEEQANEQGEIEVFQVCGNSMNGDDDWRLSK